MDIILIVWRMVLTLQDVILFVWRMVLTLQDVILIVWRMVLTLQHIEFTFVLSADLLIVYKFCLIKLLEMPKDKQ